MFSVDKHNLRFLRWNFKLPFNNGVIQRDLHTGGCVALPASFAYFTGSKYVLTADRQLYRIVVERGWATHNIQFVHEPGIWYI